MPQTDRSPKSHNIIGIGLIGLLIILLTAAAVYGSEPGKTAETEVDVKIVEATSEEIKVGDTMTMTIDLEEGGEIDLSVPDGDVVIDTWKGDQIIVIVENKAPRAGTDAEPLSLKVTRVGKNVRISTLGDSDMMGDYNVSWRIVVPEHHALAPHAQIKNSYSMAKLTAVLWRALSKEAMKWVAW